MGVEIINNLGFIFHFLMQELACIYWMYKCVQLNIIQIVMVLYALENRKTSI